MTAPRVASDRRSAASLVVVLAVLAVLGGAIWRLARPHEPSPSAQAVTFERVEERTFLDELRSYWGWPAAAVPCLAGAGLCLVAFLSFTVRRGAVVPPELAPVTEDTDRTYGNTPKTLLKVTIVGLIIAGVVYATFIIAAAAQGGIGAVRHVFKWPVVAIPAGVGLILPLVVLPTTLSNIHIEGRTIRHLFLDRWTLSVGSIDDLTSIDLGRGLFAVVLRFREGRRIRLLGAHVAQCNRL